MICSGHYPTDTTETGAHSGVTVKYNNGRGYWPEPTVLFWCGNLLLVQVVIGITTTTVLQFASFHSQILRPGAKLEIERGGLRSVFMPTCEW